MGFKKVFASGAIEEFKLSVVDRLKTRASESGKTDLVLPIGIFLVLDKENGGDVTAQELTSRFRLLGSESRNVIDFYFLGWKMRDPKDAAKGVEFDLEEFESCRTALQKAGVKKFGGNADLILCDARYSGGHITFNFEEALRVDLSTEVANKNLPNLGLFLQSIIEVAEDIRTSSGRGSTGSVVFSISDRLGLAIAQQSLLDFIMEKWGKIIGARSLAAVAVRNLGPKLDLANL